MKPLLISLILVVGITLTGCHILHVMGGHPSEAEVKRFEALPYYKDGMFVSEEPVPLTRPKAEDDKDKSFSWWRFLTPNKNAPTFTLPTKTLTRESFGEPSDSLLIYWLGHSSLMIEIEGKRILVDPVFSNAAPVPFAVRRYVEVPISRGDLPPLDYVLLTHNHYDHLEFATMWALRNRDLRFIVPLGVGTHLRKWGIADEKITELGWGDAFAENGLTFFAETARHFSGRTLFTRNDTLWVSYVLQGEKSKLFLAGDTGYGAHFKKIAERHAPFDLALIEIDGWNAMWKNVHIFPEEVIKAYHELNAKALMPVHWGVFDMANHPWNESIEKIVELAEQDGGVKLLTPMMGEGVGLESETGKWWRMDN
jgi:L-ascorbate metabolism protein UlaG (beta-lactamase superfamily)